MNAEDARKQSSILAASAFRRAGMVPLAQAASKIARTVGREVSATEQRLGAECQKGCCYCCNRLVRVSNVEAALIGHHIWTEWSLEDRAALAEKAELYEHATRFARANRLETIRAACPFLTDGLCSIYEVRPWYCRGQASTDVCACKAWFVESAEGQQPCIEDSESLAYAAGEGLIVAASESGLRPGMLELGLTVRPILKGPHLPELAARDAGTLAPATWTEGFRPRPGEPYGLSRFDQRVSENTEAIRTGKPGAEKLLPERGMNAQTALFMLQTPVAPESEDEILAARKRYENVLNRLMDLELDSGEVFDALGRYEAITLPYHGFVDRDLNAKFGSFVTHHSHLALPEFGQTVAPRKNGPILRVGFISGTMRNHQASRWAIGFLNSPPEDIETYAFQLGPHFDAMTAIWKQRASHFFMLHGSVPEAGRFIKSLELDVLVHLDPLEVARAKQFATLRLAPLQVTMWGTPFTCGFPEITHYFSSDAMEPVNAQDQYSETLLRLPGFGLCYERMLIGNPIAFDKSRLGPGPHFLVAQNSLKLLPRRDSFFKKVTEATGRPLLMIDYGDFSTERLKRRLARAAVPVQWLPKMEAQEFLGLLAAVDASLDTPDWNGSNTTIEALLVGTPVISLPGIHLRGRHTLGFYKVLGAQNLLAKDEDDYIQQVLNVAHFREQVRRLPVEELFDQRKATETIYEILRSLTAKDSHPRRA